MWDINLKTNEQDKQTETHGRELQTSGYQRGGRRRKDRGRGLKGVKYVVTEKNVTMGGEHTM